MKLRAKTVRGHQTWPGMARGGRLELALSQSQAYRMTGGCLFSIPISGFYFLRKTKLPDWTIPPCLVIIFAMATNRENPRPIWIKGVKLPKYPKPPDFQPEPVFPMDWHAPKLAGKPRCLAWAVTSGSQCNAAPVRGRLHCRKHGGKTPVGRAAGSFRTGKYCKYLPKRMLSSYEASLKDPDLLDYRAEIALLTARLDDLLARVDKGEPGHLLQEVRDAFCKLKRTMQGNETAKTVVAMERLEEILFRNESDDAAWNEVLETVKMLERAKERHTKQLVLMNQTMTVERALLLISRVEEILSRNVHDKDILQRIFVEFDYEINRPPFQLGHTVEKRSEESQGGSAGS
jgi:hypothetical protein